LALSRPPISYAVPATAPPGSILQQKEQHMTENRLSTDPWRGDPVLLVHWILGRRGADSLAVRHHRLAG
jgi:hypothetical protein